MRLARRIVLDSLAACTDRLQEEEIVHWEPFDTDALAYDHSVESEMERELAHQSFNEARFLMASTE